MATLTGRLADFTSGILMHPADVTDVTRLGDRFLRIELTSPAFRSTSWTPGAKVQLRFRRGTWDMRTFTPIAWDHERGTTAVVAYEHGGAGPAGEWLDRVAVGDPLDVFGPRGSIDLPALPRRPLFVGDETSVGLAVALRSLTDEAQYLFEAGDADGLRAVLAALGVEGATVVPDRTALLEQLRPLGAGAAGVVVTGDAATVHAVRRAVKEWAQPAPPVKGKAYWAEGRTGLD